jgi:hypothetical protein
VVARAVSVAISNPPVTLNGTIAGLAGTCPALSFTVNGTPVATNAATSYGGESICTSLKNGDYRYVSGQKQTNGQVLATYVSGAYTPEVTLTGTVASLAGTCPSLTFTVNGTAAATNSSTTFSPGACSDVKNGGSLGVVGTAGSDGRVVARAVSVASTSVTLNGTIAGLAGTCPALSFTVDGAPATTNAATTYGGGAGGSCTSLKNGDYRYVSGQKQSNGQVLATYVSGASTTEVTVTATLANVAGVCPILTFKLDDGTIATTNTSTTYGGGSACSAVKNADRWSLSGTRQSDGSLLLRYLTPAPR